MTEAQFLSDIDVEDATAYRLLAIAEAVGSLDEGIKSQHPEIPWHQIIGMRNILAHQYFARESAILWQTVKVGLPQFARVCRTELSRLGWKDRPP